MALLVAAGLSAFLVAGISADDGDTRVVVARALKLIIVLLSLLATLSIGCSNENATTLSELNKLRHVFCDNGKDALPDRFYKLSEHNQRLITNPCPDRSGNYTTRCTTGYNKNLYITVQEGRDIINSFVPEIVFIARKDGENEEDGFPSIDGYYNYFENKIVVRKRRIELCDKTIYRISKGTVVHELAHALLGPRGEDKDHDIYHYNKMKEIYEILKIRD